MQEQFRRVKEIFLAALEQPDLAAREAFVQKECGGDRDLAIQVTKLLAQHDEAGSFLEPPAASANGASGEEDETANDDGVQILTDDEPGSLIGPYKLLQRIGEGGMGIVFMAEQLEPVRRKVALKIIRPDMGSNQVIARFEAERQALALMDHENVAKIFDAGTTPGKKGRPYFVMELVHGMPITQFCDSQQLTTRERLALFVPVCRAIQHAHQKGIIHRDIKPSNVLVILHDDRPVPKVIDFGVAKAIDRQLTEQTLFTQFGALVGTLEYMSPEQVEMNALGVDTRSDVYGLGVLLYELLTGTTPLERARLRKAALDEMVRLIREEEAPKPSVRLSSVEDLPKVAAARKTEPAQLSKLVKGDLDWIVMKCLEKDRRRRYDSASGLARDLESYLADDPVEACPPTARYRLGKFARKNRKVLMTAAAFLTLLAGAAIIATLLAIWAVSAEQVALKRLKDAKDAKRAADDARAEADRQRDDARRTAYAAGIGLARRALDENNMARVTELLDELPLEAGGQNLRGFEWNYLKRRIQGPLKTLLQDSSVECLAYSPDGQRLAAGSLDGQVCVWDTSTGRETLRWKIKNGHATGLAFSPDGRRLAASQNGFESAAVWDSVTGQRLLVIKEDFSGANCVAFSPDGRHLATASEKKSVHLWDSITGAKVRVYHAEEKGEDKNESGVLSQAAIHCLAFSPDGHRLLSGGTHVPVQVWDTASGKEIRALKIPYVRGVAFDAEGRQAALRVSTGTVQIWDTATGELQSELRGEDSPWRALAFSTADGFIALAGRDRSVRLCTNPLNADFETYLGHKSSVDCIAFSPDGRTFASGGADKTVRIWDKATAFRLSRGQLELKPVAFSGDGDRVAIPDGQLGIDLFDCTTNRSQATLKHAMVQRAAISHDGRRVASAGGPLVKVWDWATGREVLSFKVDPASDDLLATPCTFLALSPEGERLLTADQQGKLSAWDVATGRPLWTIPAGRRPFNDVVFSPDGRLLATGSAEKTRTLRLWDATTGQELAAQIEHNSEVAAVAFNPDGSRLAASGKEGTVKVWHVASCSEALTLKGHTGKVTAVAFGADGRRMATGGEDRTVRLWDAGSGKELFLFHPRSLGRGIPRQLRFSADGQRLTCVDDTGEFQVWEADVTQEVLDRRAAEMLLIEVIRRVDLRADAMEWLRTAPALTTALRQQALALAETYPQDFRLLLEMAWAIAKVPGRDREAYQRALRLGEAALRDKPDARLSLQTLGMAHYRLGNNALAVENLSKADAILANELFEGIPFGSDPMILAYIAMAQHRLGKEKEAKATLERARKIIEEKLLAKDSLEMDAMHEAEAVMRQPANGAPPAAKKP